MRSEKRTPAKQATDYARGRVPSIKPVSSTPNNISPVMQGGDERAYSAAQVLNGSLLDGQSAVFDPAAPELLTSWSSAADVIYCVNTYPNGITLSVHSNLPAAGKAAQPAEQTEGATSTAQRQKSGEKFAAQQFHLRVRDTRDYQLPAGKYFLHRENYAAALEMHFSQLHKDGRLNSTAVYFGTTTDPFLSLHKKFDVTMACIALLERYVPGQVIFQTRSPMIISVLPALKALGERCVVAMPVETISEKAMSRYLPGKPRIGERLIAADGLRRQGIRVNLQASPILPYGDAKRDAWDFAEILERHADYITFGCLASGSEADEKQLKNLPIAQRLSADRQFFWLRPQCYQYVYQALKTLAPEKLMLPVKKPHSPGQLNLFAA
jgi:DNA repair photolyase